MYIQYSFFFFFLVKNILVYIQFPFPTIQIFYFFLNLIKIRFFLTHPTTTTGVVFQQVVVPLNSSLLLFHDPVHYLLFISPFLLSLFREKKQQQQKQHGWLAGESLNSGTIVQFAFTQLLSNKYIQNWIARRFKDRDAISYCDGR